MDYVNKQRQNFISLSELGNGPLEFNSGGFAYIWQSNWVGIIAIKTRRTQIHFLSDVLVAFASLDLKVPHVSELREVITTALSFYNITVLSLYSIVFSFI